MRKNSSTRFMRSIALLALTAVVPSTVFAYVGPGAGLSVIGSLLAFVAAIVVGIFGFLWFPIRRMLRKRKAAAGQAPTDADTDPQPEADAAAMKQGENEQ